jgi:hypothetical protein
MAGSGHGAVPATVGPGAAAGSAGPRGYQAPSCPARSQQTHGRVDRLLDAALGRIEQ